MLVCSSSFSQEKSYIQKKEINALMGVGFPYGGLIGFGLELNPFSKNKGLFINASFGEFYNEGFIWGYNLGIKYLLSNKNSPALIKTYAVVNYGTNSAVLIKNSFALSKVFTGFSAGINFRFNVPAKGNAFRFMDKNPVFQRFSANYSFLVPIENREVNEYRAYLLQNYNITTKKLLPFVIGVGVQFRISK